MNFVRKFTLTILSLSYCDEKDSLGILVAFSDVNVQWHATLDNVIHLASFGNFILKISHVIVLYEGTELPTSTIV